MNKFKEAVTSKTVWSVVALFLVETVPQIEGSIPVEWQPVVRGALALLAIYFRLTPKTK